MQKKLFNRAVFYTKMIGGLRVSLSKGAKHAVAKFSVDELGAGGKVVSTFLETEMASFENARKLYNSIRSQKTLTNAFKKLLK